jgi:hypothetical protein
MVAPLTELDVAPLSWIVVTILHVKRECIARTNRARFKRARPAISETNARLQAIKLWSAEGESRRDGVPTTESGARMRKRRNDAAFFGQEKEALTFAIKPTNREHPHGAFCTDERLKRLWERNRSKRISVCCRNTSRLVPGKKRCAPNQRASLVRLIRQATWGEHNAIELQWRVPIESLSEQNRSPV